jgi:hypothetical protein
MKTEFKISRKQILKLVHGSSIDNLEEWFPEVFKVELEVGKFYKSNYILKNGNKSKFFVFIIDFDNQLNYGFDYYGKWCKDMYFTNENNSLVEATTAEWESALIQEANKRGYKNGNYECLISPNFTHLTGSDFEFYKDEMRLSTKDKSICRKENIIFKDGFWAEIIKTISKEDAEKQLGCKII